MLPLVLRLLWLSAETIMMSVAQTAPSEKLQMCMMDLPSVQVRGAFRYFSPEQAEVFVNWLPDFTDLMMP